ncbi:hypothetical protein DPX16_13438 [Anabarilius grahami]|uniref:Uncharacterized protein n=1 Tax=Anabarilius grahami TaxID=495550 RepID=A0A3N0YU99_ANAGA|nr:hypothetical protein DPX16_13438 [Anabarilius grahami]
MKDGMVLDQLLRGLELYSLGYQPRCLLHNPFNPYSSTVSGEERQSSSSAGRPSSQWEGAALPCRPLRSSAALPPSGTHPLLCRQTPLSGAPSASSYVMYS